MTRNADTAPGGGMPCSAQKQVAELESELEALEEEAEARAGAAASEAAALRQQVHAGFNRRPALLACRSCESMRSRGGWRDPCPQLDDHGCVQAAHDMLPAQIACSGVSGAYVTTCHHPWPLVSAGHCCAQAAATLVELEALTSDRDNLAGELEAARARTADLEQQATEAAKQQVRRSSKP